MWLAKPVYELLPYGYVVVGTAAIVMARRSRMDFEKTR